MASRTEFDRIARVYDAGTPLALPHVLFVIDRGRGDQVAYINTRRYALHEQFLKARDGLAELGPRGLKDQYYSPQRRYLLGTLSWQSRGGKWAYEFWEGDKLTPELLQLAHARLRATFFEPLYFKPNSAQQESVAQGRPLPVLTQAELIAGQGFLPLNTGTAVGRLRVLDKAEEADDLEPDDIVLLREVPLSLPPVAGVLTTRPSTTLSHVNLLAKGWGIPNGYAAQVEPWLALQGQWVKLEVQRTGITLVPADASELAARSSGKQEAQQARRWPEPDLRRDALVPLQQLRVADRVRCGSKASNLGALAAAQRPQPWPGNAPVPDGFCIPFAAFAEFMRQPGAQQALQQATNTPGFETDRKVRHAALARLREALQALPVPEAILARSQSAWQLQLGGVGVFVRSSSNSEDLPGFSGAGLYTTVPNVTKPEALADAVKTVWASVFNSEAWEARRWSGVPHDKVVMGVFVQRAVDAKAAGVLSTLNPFDPQQPGLTYVSAKRGLGIRVVEGKRIAEQVLYNRHSNAIQVLSRSDDTVALLLDAQGGVREQAVDPTRAVLDDALVRTLARTGEQVRKLLGPAPQDIEWAIDGQGRVVLLQARPYVDRSPGRGR